MILRTETFSTETSGFLKQIIFFLSHLTPFYVLFQNNVLAPILKLTESPVKAVRSQAFEALSLVGYVPPPRGRGIKILSVDGGGTK